MSQEHEGLLHRLFQGSRHATPQTATLKLDDIQGFILRGYRMPMVRHFLLTVGCPRRGTQAARTARQRRRGRRAADHHRPRLACRVRAGAWRQSGRSAAPQARLLPQPRHHLARFCCVGNQGSRPRALVQIVWCVRRRSGRSRGAGGRHRTERAGELDRWLRHGSRPRPADIAHHQPRGHDDVQRPAFRPVRGG